MKVGCGEVFTGIAIATLIQWTVLILETSIPDDFSAITGEKAAVPCDAGREGAVKDIDPPRDACEKVLG